MHARHVGSGENGSKFIDWKIGYKMEIDRPLEGKRNSNENNSLSKIVTLKS